MRIAQNQELEPSDSNLKDDSVETEVKRKVEKGYDKNVVGYVAKKAINLMLDKYSKPLSKKCKDLSINLRQFKRIYKAKEKMITGPVELEKVFKEEPET